MSSTIGYLQLEFNAAEEISFDLVQQNLGLMALVARALELRFNLQSGGGYGGYGFCITEIPQDQRPKII
jgi:hypothetical protein